MADSERAFVVSAVEAGRRLDKLLVARFDALGRRNAAQLFRSGAVRVDGRKVPKSHLARCGETVTLAELPSRDAVARTDLDVNVRCANEHWVVINKPAGQPSVAHWRGDANSLANALAARFPELARVGSPGEAGLVHRLDTGTSGLLVAARSDEAYRTLRRSLSEGQWVKRYRAVVPAAGLRTEGRISLGLGPHPRSNRRVIAVPNSGSSRKAARVTRFVTLVHNERWALVEASVERAYRHQIRAHFAAIGHPLAGDVLYGGAIVPGLDPGRHALHAHYLQWAGDSRIEGFAVEAPEPRDLLSLVGT